MIRYKTYSRCIIETNQVERHTFCREHYQNAGIPLTPEDGRQRDLPGIPELEALRLVNSWNSRGLRYIYWI